MTDYRKFYEKDYLGAWDLKDDVDTVVRITKVVGGNIVGPGGRKTKKPVVYVHGTEKGLVLGATTGKTIAGMYGPQIEDWVGKRIALYKTTTNSAEGGVVDCIRVRPQIPEPKGGAAPSRPPPPDEQLGEASHAMDTKERTPITVSDAIAHLPDFKDADELAEWAAGLPPEITADDQFANAYRDRDNAIRIL